MTHDELKKTGKNGVYRADLDQWFIEGEEPTQNVREKIAKDPTPIKPAPEPNDKPAAPEAALKTTKGAKNNG